MSSTDPSRLTVVQLKEILKEKGLKTVGSRAELMGRLMEADPTGECFSEHTEKESEAEQNITSGSGVSRDSEDRGSNEHRTQPNMEQLQREKDFAERELAFARREIELLQQIQQLNMQSTRPTMPDTTNRSESQYQPRINVTAIADLLGYFDGNGSAYVNWEKQVRVLRTMYKLQEDASKILIGSRLKGKALEWFHSRAEFIDMPVEAFLTEMKIMFYHRPNKIAMRRQFENRVWTKGETFSEYLHDKVILGNNVPIDEDEIVAYIIDGIPDPVLRDQARIQRFNDQATLLEAFETVTLRYKTNYTSHVSLSEDNKKKYVSNLSGKRLHRSEDNYNQYVPRTNFINKRCHSCGSRNHLAGDCPTRDKGSKCFECRGFGHIAVNCPKKQAAPRDSCIVSHPSSNKYYKGVVINGHQVKALIDTGSDLCLMRADKYIKLGSPELQHKEIRFRGVGSNDNCTIGEFCADIVIDGNTYPIIIRVISDSLMQHELLIGTDFLNTVATTIIEGKISIAKLEDVSEKKVAVPEVFHIDCEHEVNQVDVSNIANLKHRSAIEKMIESYNPVKVVESAVRMNIVIKDKEPVYQRARRLSPSEKEEVNAQIHEWLRDGVAQLSISEYASPVVLVKKKDGTTRLCVDYRKMNAKIVRDRYPLPLIEDQLDALQNARVFSTLDLKNGFFHVSIEKDSRKYTSFIVPDGQYEFLKTPFGLANSPATFQKFINATFRDLINDKIVLTYLDDLIIPTADYDSGLVNLQKVLNIAARSGLILNWKKCCFLQTRVEFLGHIVENGNVYPSKLKTEAVMQFARPKNVRQVQSFLGLAGYFRKFIHHYSEIARPLSNLLRANVKFRFDSEEELAFTRLKIALSNKPVLRLYRVGSDTELHTDASMYGYGVILLQRDSEDGLLHPVYYASGKTTPAEEKYISYELEVLAVIKALRKFRNYLLGVTFKIVTDCRAFALTMNKKVLCIRVARWALELAEFKYTIEHRPGSRMTHVDALSRNPLPCSLAVDECEESILTRLRKAQQEDENLKKILDLSEQKQIDGYVVRGKLLFKEIDDDLRLVVPKSMQSQLIKRTHERGHFAANKTEILLKRDYWFPNMRPRIEKVIRNCIDCILAERKHGKQEGFLHPIEKGNVPLDTYHIDHLGPLPSTRKNYKHIFVVTDAFSKFVWLYTTKTTNTSEVLDRLRKQATIFANPRRIVSDRGTAFTSHDFKEYCKEEGIEHVLITTGVPRANGQVERVNRTIIPLLTKLSAPKPEEWFKHLEKCQKYFNMIPSRSTGTSPFKLLFGTEMRLKDDPNIRELIESELITAFEHDRDELRLQAKDRIQKIQQENRRSFNKRRKEAERYRENDLVAIKRTQLGPGLKFAHKYLGPYIIVKSLRNDRYMVHKVGEHEGPLQTSTVADHMKPWITGLSDDSSEEEEEEDNNI